MVKVDNKITLIRLAKDYLKGCQPYAGGADPGLKAVKALVELVLDNAVLIKESGLLEKWAQEKEQEHKGKFKADHCPRLEPLGKQEYCWHMSQEHDWELACDAHGCKQVKPVMAKPTLYHNTVWCETEGKECSHNQPHEHNENCAKHYCVTESAYNKARQEPALYLATKPCIVFVIPKEMEGLFPAKPLCAHTRKHPWSEGCTWHGCKRVS